MSLKTLFICLLVGTSLNATIGMEVPSDKLQISGAHQPKIFKSAQEMYDHAKTILCAAEKENWNLVKYLAFPKPEIGYNQISLSDIEGYTYNRTEALYRYYMNIIEHNPLDTPLCIKSYENIVQETNAYISSFGNFKSQVNSFNERMISHRYFIFDHYGQVCFNLGGLLNANHGSSDQILMYLSEAKAAYENVIEYGNKTLKLPYIVNDSAICELIRKRLLIVQLNLISTIGSLVQILPAGAGIPLIQRARQLQKQFKARKQDGYFQKASTTIRLMEKALEAKRIDSKPKGTKGVEAIRNQKFFKIQEEMIEAKEKQYADYDGELKVNKHLIDTIDTKQKMLNSIIALKENGWAEKMIHGLFDIENEIKEFLVKEVGLSDLSVSEISLETIYDTLGGLLGKDSLINQYWKYVAPFIVTSNIEGGIQRADILKDIAIDIGDKKSFLYRLIAAGLKNLQGDHDEWLALEEELEKEVELIKQEKAEAKAEAHQRKVKTLQAFLAEQEKQNKEKKSKKSVVRSSAPSNKVNNTQDSAEANAYDSQPLAIDDKQRKLGKHKRHEENEKKRDLERKEKEEAPKKEDSLVKLEPRPLSKLEQKVELRERILQSSNKSLAELYGLSGRPLEVDKEIEGDTWGFTRDDFEIYVRAMGCEHKDGKGVHTKASLPKATHIMRGDILVTIFNEFGGALTLPLWDKDYVPDYLKTQILEARKNLRALKILEMQATQQWVELKKRGKGE